MKMTSQILVKGSRIDDQTHCIHYQSELDIIAIKLKCCQTYYPCIRCHQAEADHAVQRWAIQELHLNALLCGACKNRTDRQAISGQQLQLPQLRLGF